jgi:hypothetical protein
LPLLLLPSIIIVRPPLLLLPSVNPIIPLLLLPVHTNILPVLLLLLRVLLLTAWQFILPVASCLPLLLGHVCLCTIPLLISIPW